MAGLYIDGRRRDAWGASAAALAALLYFGVRIAGLRKAAFEPEGRNIDDGPRRNNCY
jgi:hypothetical protein